MINLTSFIQNSKYEATNQIMISYNKNRKIGFSNNIKTTLKYHLTMLDMSIVSFIFSILFGGCYIFSNYLDYTTSLTSLSITIFCLFVSSFFIYYVLASLPPFYVQKNITHENNIFLKNRFFKTPEFKQIISINKDTIETLKSSECITQLTLQFRNSITHYYIDEKFIEFYSLYNKFHQKIEKKSYNQAFILLILIINISNKLRKNELFDIEQEILKQDSIKKLNNTLEEKIPVKNIIIKKRKI